MLDGVAKRVGEFAVWLSRRQRGQAVGIMITASHNPVGDNGIKIIMPNGEMMGEEYEALLEEFANRAVEELPSILGREEGFCCVALARDTRPSGPHLAALIGAAVEGQPGARLLDWGLCTTPEAHAFVRLYNEAGLGDGVKVEVLRQAYLDTLQVAETMELAVDCANGVGALPLKCLSFPNFALVNCGEGLLNWQCGADWVKTEGRAPAGDYSAFGLAASLDGDADRVVFFQPEPFQLLDGDRIACLFATLLRRLAPAQLQIGVVQTAYANGAATRYLQSLGVEIACTPTGVKHLHKAAHDYAVGIYFEANGHGTVLFKEAMSGQLSDWARLFNPCVGDGIADLLAVLEALRLLGWSASDWIAMYKDLPNVLRKVSVPRRGMIKTIDADRHVVEPAGLQAEIDRLVGGYPQARAFVRASGTETVVRIYAEAASIPDANALADALEQLVHAHLV